MLLASGSENKMATRFVSSVQNLKAKQSKAATNNTKRHCLDTRKPGTDVRDLTPASPKFSKAYSNVLKAFDICLEMPSDAETHFGFVVDDFSELVRTKYRDVCVTFCF